MERQFKEQREKMLKGKADYAKMLYPMSLKEIRDSQTGRAATKEEIAERKANYLKYFNRFWWGIP